MFKEFIDIDQATSINIASGNDPEQGTSGNDQAANNPDPKESGTKDEPDEQDDDLPIPVTFALQLADSVVHHLMKAGTGTYMLTHNFCQHGTVGEFFNPEFYHDKMGFKVARKQYSEIDKAARDWIRGLSGKGQIKGNTLMININLRESCDARSFSNVGNVNFTLANLVDLLDDKRFVPTRNGPNGGKVMVIVPYEAQRNLYAHKLQKRAAWEINSKEILRPFNKAHIDVRTHHGAQGHKASIVIVDLTRSNAPGHTGYPQLVNQCVQFQSHMRPSGADQLVDV